MSNKIKIDDVKGLFRCDYEGIWKKNYEIENQFIIQRVDQVDIGTIDKGTIVTQLDTQPLPYYMQLQDILEDIQDNTSIEEIRARIEETINQGYVLYQP